MNSQLFDKKHLPMILTYSRIAVVPFLVTLMLSDWQWSGIASAIVFVLFSMTDWLDGYLARKWGTESNMGKFMDPIADKILVLTPLVVLLGNQRIDAVMVLILLSRDIFIGGLRSVAATNNVIIAAKPFGKWKTGLQMVSIPLILIDQPLFGLPLYEIGYYGLWFSVVLSLISGTQYTLGYYKNRNNPS